MDLESLGQCARVWMSNVESIMIDHIDVAGRVAAKALLRSIRHALLGADGFGRHVRQRQEHQPQGLLGFQFLAT